MSGFGEMRGMTDFERDMWNGGYGPSGKWWMRDDEPDCRLSDGSIPETAPPAMFDDPEHSVTCKANDLDPLDHAPCTCGLRATVNPWGRPYP